MSKKWTTGLFGFLDDLPVFIYGCSAYQCLVIDSYTRFKDGTAAFNLPAKKLADPFACAGCTDYDAAWCINMCICNILPCIVILWRKEIREKYQIKGNIFGDAIVHCCCSPLGGMQEAREVRLNKPAPQVVQMAH